MFLGKRLDVGKQSFASSLIAIEDPTEGMAQGPQKSRLLAEIMFHSLSSSEFHRGWAS
jgi:hypothetical protein